MFPGFRTRYSLLYGNRIIKREVLAEIGNSGIFLEKIAWASSMIRMTAKREKIKKLKKVLTYLLYIGILIELSQRIASFEQTNQTI